MQDNFDECQLQIENLQQENNLLRAKMDKMLLAEEDAKARIVDATRQAEEMKKATQIEYSLSLKQLMNFNKKFARVTSENSDKTAEIMASLSTFLSEIGKTSPKEIIEKIDKKIFSETTGTDGGETEFEFDLEEAINPKQDLDLKTLCEELGVYRG